MYDFAFTAAQLALRDEIRDLVRSVPRQLVLDMDADKVEFPTEFLREAGQRGLLGCRYPRKWGGRDLRLASIWTGTNEVMAMITASEWYREHRAAVAVGATRDVEQDAAQADAVQEKVYS